MIGMNEARRFQKDVVTENFDYTRKVLDKYNSFEEFINDCDYEFKQWLLSNNAYEYFQDYYDYKN